MEQTKRLNKLKVLKRLSIQNESQLVTALGLANNKHQLASEKLVIVECYLKEYKDIALEKGKKGINAQALKQQHTFLQNLEYSVCVQRDLVNNLKRKLEVATCEYTDALAKTKAIDTILNKRMVDIELFNEKKLTRELEDQISSMRAIQQSGGK